MVSERLLEYFQGFPMLSTRASPSQELDAWKMLSNHIIIMFGNNAPKLLDPLQMFVGPRLRLLSLLEISHNLDNSSKQLLCTEIGKLELCDFSQYADTMYHYLDDEDKDVRFSAIKAYSKHLNFSAIGYAKSLEFRPTDSSETRINIALLKMYDEPSFYFTADTFNDFMRAALTLDDESVQLMNFWDVLYPKICDLKGKLQNEEELNICDNLVRKFIKKFPNLWLYNHDPELLNLV
jgi:hypothetical protein